MYPIREPRLRITEIARHWSRDLRQKPPTIELLDKLLKAFWQGEFDGHTSAAGESHLGGRQWALDVLAAERMHPGICFLTPDENRKHPWNPDRDENEESIESYDVLQRVLLPRTGKWTKGVLDRACKVLAQRDCPDFDPETVKTLTLIEIDGIAFRQWAKTQGWQIPWWQEPTTSRYQKNTAEREKRKRETQKRYELWREKAREIYESNPKLLVSEICRQISKMDIAKGYDFGTVRRQVQKKHLVR